MFRVETYDPRSRQWTGSESYELKPHAVGAAGGLTKRGYDARVVGTSTGIQYYPEGKTLEGHDAEVRAKRHPDDVKPAAPVAFDRLSPEVRAIVMAGWVAVVYRGMQVTGIFPQQVFAGNFISSQVDYRNAKLEDFEVVRRPG